MKKLLVWMAAAGLVFGAVAQDAEDPSAARQRISHARAQVEAAFKAEEKACYGKFAVNDCRNAARARRREAIADLKRQETSINDAERKARGAERQRAIEEKAEAGKRGSPAQPHLKDSPPAPGTPTPRGGTIGEREAARAQTQAKNAAAARERRQQAELKAREKKEDLARRKQEAARNSERQRQQQANAQAHKASVNQRLAERKKPPAQPLPAPP